MPMKISLKDVDIVAPNIHGRHTGVTSTIIALLPHQMKECRIASCGPGLPDSIPRFSYLAGILGGWGRKRVLHARRNNEMLIALFLKYFLRQPLKIVFTSAAQRELAAFTHFMLRWVDVVIATSEIAASYVRRPSILIPHGVDLNRFCPPDCKEDAWKKTGLPGKYGVGVFGRVREQKGTDLFVQAMIELLPRFPDWTAVVTGLEAADERDFVAGLKQRILDAGLEDRIFMLGVRPFEEVPGWFQAVTLYVAPMRSEGFGLTTLEAMASGAAVVATRAGASPQIVSDSTTGTLVPVEDQEALTAAIEPFLANPEFALETGRRGRARAEQYHSIEQEARELVKVYQSLLAEN